MNGFIPRRPRTPPMGRLPSVRLVAALAIAAATMPGAHALVQTSQERAPTSIPFAHRMNGTEGALYAGMALFCEFPEQFAPDRPNPRWEDERPWRLHFVERLNPAFSRCMIRTFIRRPEFVDHEIQAVMRFEFEKAIPPKMGLAPVGDRQVEMKQAIFLDQGTRFRLPDFTGSPDQAMKIQLRIHGKLVGEVELQVDSKHTLRIREVRRPDLNDAPIRRAWDLR